jgi:hypothetical protein
VSIRAWWEARSGGGETGGGLEQPVDAMTWQLSSVALLWRRNEADPVLRRGWRSQEAAWALESQCKTHQRLLARRGGGEALARCATTRWRWGGKISALVLLLSEDKGKWGAWEARGRRRHYRDG